MWAEENGKGEPTTTDAAGELRSAGISASGIGGDMDAAGDLSAPDDMQSETEEGAPPGGAAPGPGGAAPAPGA